MSLVKQSGQRIEANIPTMAEAAINRARTSKVIEDKAINTLVEMRKDISLYGLITAYAMAKHKIVPHRLLGR
ncbi:hypothetical protein QYF36_006880 [Acer negundo]|nr:hypothetical protein QYF36_006880 [Acer negundo]